MPPAPQLAAVKRWCITVNNPTPSHLEAVTALVKECDWIVCSLEHEFPWDGTPHYQMALALHSRCRRSKLTKAIVGAHAEPMLGTDQQAYDYCRKTDCEYTEIVNIPPPEKRGQQGKRSDLAMWKQSYEAGKRGLELRDDHFAVWAHYEGLEKRMRLSEPPASWRDVYVEVIWGDTGVGKTRSVWEGKTVYDVYSHNMMQDKWDGYADQPTVLFDDFYGQIKISAMLKLLDGHPFCCSARYNDVWARWTKVVITSNVHPSEWWGGKEGGFSLKPDTIPPEVRKALMRRVTKVTHLVAPQKLGFK